MCGIVGYVGKGNALSYVLSGLERLEYRGYDSAGVAMYGSGSVKVTRAPGKLMELKKRIDGESVNGDYHTGIGHTRWATHGRPSEANAHPHCVGRVSLIHNGIIENYAELKEAIKAEGYEFRSETDTEVAAYLLRKNLDAGLDSLDALRAVCGCIRGSYSFVAIDERDPDKLLVAKNATPIIIGLGEGEMLVASDIPALIDLTRRIMVLEDGDIAEIRADKVLVKNGGRSVERSIQTVTWDAVAAKKGGYAHYMLKEINEQSRAIASTFAGRIDREAGRVSLPEISIRDEQINAVERVVLTACGTAWHACLLTKHFIESIARIPCSVDYASELRYRNPVLDEKTLVIGVSQSGETADTLAAVDLAAQRSATLAICNVLGSSLARKIKNVVFTHAGPEISVASTKAFTTQLVAGYLLAIYLGQRRGSLTPEDIRALLGDLAGLPDAVEETVRRSERLAAICRPYANARDFLFLGRGLLHPVALEGALKLKEITYIHAEGYPAGEMKHGPIALIDERMPVVTLLQRSPELFQKSLSNLKEVEARGGKILCFTDAPVPAELREICASLIELPHVSELLSPVIFTLPLQLLAYYTAVQRGLDVDLPRNLAKSVTVE